MAWLERLISFAFVAVIVLLLTATTGAVIVIAIAAPVGLAITEVSERRVGFGTGCVVAGALALIKGILGAVSQARHGSIPSAD